jgi:hypothetical protein
MDVWSHADVRAADMTGLVLDAEAADRRRKQFAAEVDAARKEQVSRLIGGWHGELPRELLRAETLVWHALVPGTAAAPPGDLDDALAFAGRLAATARAREGDPVFAAAVRHYGRTLLRAMPAAIYDVVPSLKIVWAAAFQGVDGVPVPPNLDPRALFAELPRAGGPRWWAVRQVESRLVFSPSSSGGAWPSHETGPDSPVAWLLAGWPHVYVRRGRDGGETQLLLDRGLSIPLIGR